MLDMASSLDRFMTIPGAALILVLSGIVLFLIHRFFLHPLAKYPGPFLGRLTTAYAAYHAWKGDIHLDIQRCHVKYGQFPACEQEETRRFKLTFSSGSFVRYAPGRLVINTKGATQGKYIRAMLAGYGSHVESKTKETGNKW